VFAADPERAERESVRRAQVAIRRAVTEHELVRMVTLTFRESTTAEQRGEGVRRVQHFLKRLKRRIPQLRYIAVPEWHPGGHGWHWHVLIDRYVSKQLVADLWGWGFVDVRLIRPKSGAGGKEATRKAAAYAAKYIGPPQDAESGAPAHQRGDQRYLRSEGLDITEVEMEGDAHSLIVAAWSMLGKVTWMWWSGWDSTWRAGPVLVLRGG